MRHLVLTGFLVGACLCAGWTGYDSVSSPCRPLTAVEAARIRAGAFHYCALPYPTGQACSTCFRSIHWVTIQMMPGMPPMSFNLYDKCSSTPANQLCWQTSYAQTTPPTPTPTCDLNQSTCAGLMAYFVDANCTSPYTNNPPYEPCSMWYPAGYKAGTPGTANIPCIGIPNVQQTN